MWISPVIWRSRLLSNRVRRTSKDVSPEAETSRSSTICVANLSHPKECLEEQAFFLVNKTQKRKTLITICTHLQAILGSSIRERQQFGRRAERAGEAGFPMSPRSRSISNAMVPGSKILRQEPASSKGLLLESLLQRLSTRRPSCCLRGMIKDERGH